MGTVQSTPRSSTRKLSPREKKLVRARMTIEQKYGQRSSLNDKLLQSAIALCSIHGPRQQVSPADKTRIVNIWKMLHPDAARLGTIRIRDICDQLKEKKKELDQIHLELGGNARDQLNRSITNVAYDMMNGAIANAKRHATEYAGELQRATKNDRKTLYAMIFTGALALAVYYETLGMENLEVQAAFRNDAKRVAKDVYMNVHRKVRSKQARPSLN